jgi:hypothetical protein
MLRQGLKLLARAVPLERRARLLAAVVPPERWFRAAVLMSRWHAKIIGVAGRSRPAVREAYLRDDLLIELSRLGPFPVPMRVIGAETLELTASDRGGIVLCATHIPLLMSVIRAAILTGHTPDLIVAAPHNIRLENSQIQPTGMSEGVPAMPPGPNALLRIRTILRRQGLIACTLDGHTEASPDLLVLAGRLGARVVTFRTGLAPDGTVTISFQNAVHPFCDSYEAIEANMKAIQEDERRVFANLQNGPAHLTAESRSNTAPDVLSNSRRKFPAISPTTRKFSDRL